MTEEPRCFSPVAAGFSNYNGKYSLPLVLAQGSPIIHSSCEGELGSLCHDDWDLGGGLSGALCLEFRFWISPGSLIPSCGPLM